MRLYWIGLPVSFRGLEVACMQQQPQYFVDADGSAKTICVLLQAEQQHGFYVDRSDAVRGQQSEAVAAGAVAAEMPRPTIFKLRVHDYALNVVVAVDGFIS